MAAPLRVAAAQIDTTVGDFDGNCRRVREETERARAAGAQLVAFPELTIPGYPPRDLLELGSFLRRGERALAELAAPAEWSKGIAVVVGFAETHAGPGAGVYNAAAVLQDGRVTVARKMLLPTYDVFDEGRYFDPGEAPTRVEVAGARVGVTICEDCWNDKAFWAQPRYGGDPIELLSAQGVDLIVNLSASPYAIGKPRLRERMLGAAAQRHGLPMLYVNLVGGNDSLLFDGRSLLLDRAGAVVARGPAFREGLLLAGEETPPPLPGENSEGELAEILVALEIGIRDYASKAGFKAAVVGLSGGVDSALTACLAARALGADNVRGVALPSRYTADMSTDDARALAGALGIQFEVIPIETVFAGFLGSLAPSFAELDQAAAGSPGKGRGARGHRRSAGRSPSTARAPDVTNENLQARIRGTLLMAISNKRGELLLSTGNKSELSVGYCTLYGDMAGGLAAIGDLPKTLVYRLARQVNSEASADGLRKAGLLRREGAVIPERTLVRPPTAELRPGQTDQDSLPPYETLDEIVRLSVEERRSSEEIVARGFPADVVRKVLGLLVRSEYKRRQAAPVLRVTSQAFGEGWRFPIAQRFER